MKYLNIQEVERDLTHMRNNPNDQQFFDVVLKKYEGSSDEMKAEVKDLLYDRLFDTQITLVLQGVSLDNPDKMVVAKTKDDPFFEV